MGFGNSGKDALVGPRNTNFTTALYKSFAITESARVELRVDSFNTFNHTQFNNFNNAETNTNFGEVTGARDPRVFELGGKFIF
jgi:TPP-dependent trihydroxycyclohexane-1,2-dione (THcHDO) dehydratase